MRMKWNHFLNMGETKFSIFLKWNKRFWDRNIMFLSKSEAVKIATKTVLTTKNLFLWQLLMLLSQAAACGGQIYTVNFDNPQPGTQINLLPLFED